MNREQLTSDSIYLRWLNVQTYELKLTNGKTILFDPMITRPTGTDLLSRLMTIPDEYGITKETVETIDYIILNHTHVDHIFDLGYYAKKFGALVICHNSVALEVAKIFDIPFTQIFPVGNSEIYHFDDFTLQTFHGMHNTQPMHYSEHWNPTKEVYGVEGREKLDAMGGIFNTNYLITTPENYRIAFTAGQSGPLFRVLIRSLAPCCPNLLLRHIPGRIPKGAAAIFAEEIQALRVPLMLPMHHEKTDSTEPEVLDSMFEEINQILENNHFVGRAFIPVRGKWYRVYAGIQMADS